MNGFEETVGLVWVGPLHPSSSKEKDSACWWVLVLVLIPQH